jgi:hypothetical protein
LIVHENKQAAGRRGLFASEAGVASVQTLAIMSRRPEAALAPRAAA